MPEPSSDQPGQPRPDAVQTVAHGYLLAWRLRWTLLRLTVVALAPALVLTAVAELVFTGGATAIVNGTLVTASRTGPAGMISLVALLLGWGVAVAGGVTLTAGYRRGITVDLTRTLRAVIAAPGSIAGLLIVVVAAGVGMFLVLGWLLVALIAPLGAVGAVGFVVGLAGIGLVLCRLLVSLPLLTLDPGRSPLSAAMALTRGRIWPTAGAVLIGGFGLPWLMNVVLVRLRDFLTEMVVLDGPAGLALSMMLAVLGNLWLVVVVILQVGVLTTSYLCPRPNGHTGESADLAALDSRLRALSESGRNERRWVWASALVVLPPVLTAVVTIGNPYGAPTVSAQPRSLDAEGMPTVIGAAWFDGNPPVVTSGFSVHECNDDACNELITRPMHGFHQASAVTDRGLISADVRENHLTMQSCPLAGVCERAATLDAGTQLSGPIDVPGREREPVDDVALITADDGTVWLATARELLPQTESDDYVDDSSVAVELALTWCADWTCGDHVTTVLGTVEALMPAEDDDPFAHEWWPDAGPSPADLAWSEPLPRLTIHIDAAGRPVIAYRGMDMWLGSCAAARCTAPELRNVDLGGIDYSIPLGGVNDRVLWWSRSGQIVACDAETCDEAWIPGIPPGSPLGPLAVQVTELGLLAVVTESVPVAGFEVSFGESGQDEEWLISLVHCPDVLCRDATRIPLAHADTHLSQAVVLAKADGQVRILTGEGYEGLASGHSFALTLPSVPDPR